MGSLGVLTMLPDVAWLGLGLPAWFTLATVLVATVLMILDRGGPDLVMFLTVCALLVAGVISTDQAFAGFADPATIVIGVLFVVARAIQDTGVLIRVSNAMFGGATGLRPALLRLVAPIAVMSAFLNNTPIVAMFVPVGNAFARRIQVSPSKFLMPLSFAAMVGGVCTLIGTSTNLVVSGLMTQAGMPPLGMFELTAVGVPTALAALAYMVITGPWLLPDRVDPLTSAKAEAREYLAELQVAPDSPLVGQGIEAAGLRHLPGLFLVEIRRKDGGVLQPVAPEDVLEPDDHLVFTGVASMIRDLTAFPGLTATGQTPDPGANLYEVVVAHHSNLVNRTVRDANFRRRFDAAILAVHRAGERMEGRIGDIILQAGDTLMLTASPGFRRTWERSDDFYLVTEVPFDGHPAYRKAPLALTALGLMVLLPALTPVSMMQASVAALLFLVATRCVTPRAARKSVEWPVLVLIGASFGVSEAMVNSGAGRAVGDTLVAGLLPWGPLALLAGTYVLTTVFTLFVSNAAAAAIMFPIVLSTAQAAELDPRPFAIALTLAASAAFATPVGYQTNLMVYGPGGYRYLDFVRFGAPLNVITFVIAMAVVPMVWPLI